MVDLFYYHITSPNGTCTVAVPKDTACRYVVIKACNGLGLEPTPDMALSRFPYGNGFADPLLPAPDRWVKKNNVKFTLARNEEYGCKLECRTFIVHKDSLRNKGSVVYVPINAKIYEIVTCYGLSAHLFGNNRPRFRVSDWSVITSRGKMNSSDSVSIIDESDIVITTNVNNDVTANVANDVTANFANDVTAKIDNHVTAKIDNHVTAKIDNYVTAKIDNHVTDIVSDKPPAVQITIPTSGETCTVNVSHDNKDYVIQMPNTLCVGDIAFIIGVPDPFNASFTSVASCKPVEDSLFVSELPAGGLEVCSNI